MIFTIAIIAMCLAAIKFGGIFIFMYAYLNGDVTGMAALSGVLHNIGSILILGILSFHHLF